MTPTKALYVDWHLPRKNSGKNVPFRKAWEIAMIIRTTYFSKHINNLSPVLYCDKDIYDYYESIDLLKHFDEVHPILPDSVDFNPTVFWAAGKFFAMLHCQENFLMMDLDAEVRFKIDFENSDVYCAHMEDVSEGDIWFYPDPLYLDSNDMLGRKHNIEWSDLACNTSILAFKELSLAKEYASSALEFIRSIESVNPAFEKVAYILLAEQRFLYEFVRSKNLELKTLIQGRYVPTALKNGPAFIDSDVDAVGEKGFLHVWGFKVEIHGDEEAEQTFFGSLITSRLNLRDDIVGSVSRNYELYVNT
jgi:hypothetical protein